jgi:hypothetical protein
MVLNYLQENLRVIQQKKRVKLYLPGIAVQASGGKSILLTDIVHEKKLTSPYLI